MRLKYIFIYILLIWITNAKTCYLPENTLLDTETNQFYTIKINDIIQFSDKKFKITNIEIQMNFLNKIYVYDGNGYLFERENICKPMNSNINTGAKFCGYCAKGGCKPYYSCGDDKINMGNYEYKEAYCGNDIDLNTCEQTEKACSIIYKGYETITNEREYDVYEIFGYLLEGVDGNNKYISKNITFTRPIEGIYLSKEEIITNYKSTYSLLCEDSSKYQCIMNKNIATKKIISSLQVNIPFSNSYSNNVTNCNVSRIDGINNCDCKTSCIVDIFFNNQPCIFVGELFMCNENLDKNLVLPNEYCNYLSQQSSTLNSEEKPKLYGLYFLYAGILLVIIIIVTILIICLLVTTLVIVMVIISFIIILKKKLKKEATNNIESTKENELDSV